jgi:hypothetical protein
MTVNKLSTNYTDKVLATNYKLLATNYYVQTSMYLAITTNYQSLAIGTRCRQQGHRFT